MQFFKKGLMNKVKSKKDPDDHSQNSDALQSFKHQVMKKLSPQKEDDSDNIKEKLNIRPYNPDEDIESE